MIHAIRKSFWVLTAGWLVVTGCGDDDDTDTPATGGSAGAMSGGSGGKGDGGKGGGTSSGGKASGGSGGNASGGASGGGGAPAEGGAGGQSSNVQCEVLGELCHEADTGSGPASDCHDIGHSGDAAACKAAFAGCIAVCVGGEPGHGGAGGAAGGGAGGGGSTAAPHCAALGELCHPVSSQGPALDACHDLGHVGDEAACEEQFVTCALACLAAREGHTGTGGAGGMSGGGAGGAGGSVGVSGNGGAGGG